MNRQKMSLISGKATNYDSVLFLACNDIRETLYTLNAIEIDARAIDYDPKFEDYDLYECKDFVFDEVNLDAELVVHMNCEKTFPFDRTGDVILIGDDERHNGDCVPILSCNQLTYMYDVKEVYEEHVIEYHGKHYYIVWGRM